MWIKRSMFVGPICRVNAADSVVAPHGELVETTAMYKLVLVVSSRELVGRVPRLLANP
jgi:hypothetical protein